VQAGGDTRPDDGNEVVEIAIHWCREFEGPEADVVESSASWWMERVAL